MSEYTMTTVVCDRCYSEDLPSYTFFPLESIRGVFRGTRSQALSMGWEEKDYGDVCPDCAKLEAEIDGEVLLGAAAIDSIGGTGGDDGSEDDGG